MNIHCSQKRRSKCIGTLTKMTLLEHEIALKVIKSKFRLHSNSRSLADSKTIFTTIVFFCHAFVVCMVLFIT